MSRAGIDEIFRDFSATFPPRPWGVEENGTAGTATTCSNAAHRPAESRSRVI